MKKISLILILLILTACKETTPEYALIKGQINNNEAISNLSLTNNDRDFKYEITLMADGRFRDSLAIEPGLYTLSAGRRKSTQIVFFKGDNLTITCDANDFEGSLTFHGKGSSENYELQTINKSIQAYEKERPKDYLLGETDFKNLVLKQQNELLSLLNSSHELNPLFKTKLTRHLKYWRLNSFSYYPVNHRYYAKDPDFNVSDDFLEETDHLDYERDDDYKESKYYQSLVSRRHWENIDSLLNIGKLTKAMARIEAANLFKTEFIRNALLRQTIMGILISENTFKPSLEAYMKLSTNQDHKKKVAQKYQEVKSLEKGNLSPKFVNYENYKGGVTSLDQLNGKYVYIDVWATWCGPCKAEIPFLKEVEKKYHGNKNIEFVSISVDKQKDYDKWRTMIKEKELSGVQLIADNAFNSDFVKSYQIRGIPQFILIDPQGNIVNRSAPRPSSPDLIDLFNDLNI
ncbi:TlpA disulfide reductase family protein [Gaetbulibacter sp. M240]|uniref:TlpA family protein disulfide reductase n=1 Tax=Gaetbulibacter sp. M240 TaxID=3126511 RepID=UPI00374EB674